MRLAGKTAIITGAATGIGAVYAQALVNERAHVVVADVLEAPGQDIVRKLNAQGDRKALFVKTDVTSDADTERMAQVAVETFGSRENLIELITMKTGFCSAPYFSQTFKRLTGKTPRTYRYSSIESVESASQA